jgi:hypothetical protein
MRPKGKYKEQASVPLLATNQTVTKAELDNPVARFLTLGEASSDFSRTTL